MNYYFLKLIPPRPDFMMTMTEAERALMGAHQAYWRGYAEKGWAVAYGPGADSRAAMAPGAGWPPARKSHLRLASCRASLLLARR